MRYNGILSLLLTLSVVAAPSVATVGNRAVVSNREWDSRTAIRVPPADTAAPLRELTSAAQAAAQTQASSLDWLSVNGGGVIRGSSSSHRAGLSVGQTVVVACSSSTHRAGLGFWYGTPSCTCDCHADPKCDGVTNVYDVVLTVGVAFRGEPDIPDSNALCPLMTTDVDCDGVTKIFDVVKLINVAFRSIDPATEFCNPCAP